MSSDSKIFLFLFKRMRSVQLVVLICFYGALVCFGQSIGGGTIRGKVTDPTGAVIPGASVSLSNPVSGYRQQTQSSDDGSFQLANLPPNTYHIEITANGFSLFHQDVPVRGTIPFQLLAKLDLASSKTQVNVEASGADVLEVEPTTHVDADRSLIEKLPVPDPGGALSQAITMTTGGVAADANGFFHPLGDHAQTTFVIDGQPISDQQSKVFSTQLPTSAIQSMELDTGAVDAEFGDKTSLVAQVTTRSGLGSKGWFGNVEANYGSFGTAGGSIGLGWGNAKIGNFLALDGVRSGRFLDSPEFRPYHDIGNNQSYFDRFDYQLSPNDIFHFNLFSARNWIQIPNSLDQLQQDQRQKVVTWSVAPGYQHTFSSNALLTVNPYARKDQFEYFGNPLTDSPATQTQNRHLFNYGVKSDLSLTRGHHNLKLGIDLKQTRLYETFQFGITDPTFNAPCLNSAGDAITNPAVINPVCTGAGQFINTSFSPGLLPYDLTRGGKQFTFVGAHNINQYAAYIQDSISWRNFVFNVGIRGDMYYGLVSRSEPGPRAGVAYHVAKTGTVLRAAYSRTFETPFNENLLLSNATGVGGLAQNGFGTVGVQPIQPGHRNQFNAGLQQSLGKWLLLDADYFWKYTHNAFDFSALLNTTITFPIAWHNSKLDGVTGRVSTTNIHGFQAYWNFGHTRARYFPPATGGFISDQPSGPFRIDHDQVFESTANLRYQRPKNAEWATVVWRYDSGMVVSGVPDVAAALELTGNQQTSIGFACNGVYAMPTTPIRTCNGVGSSTVLNLPQTGTENDDHNPARVQPRHVFDVGFGTDNLLHSEGKKRIVASLQVTNLTNKVAVYNFLSTFSGTHFLQPRGVVGRVGFSF